MSRRDKRLEQALERQIKANKNKALDWLVHRVEQDCRPFVPRDTGALVSNTKIENHTLIYEQPYAHYMYEGILYVDPETGSSWARRGVKKVPTGIPLKYRPTGTDHWLEHAELLHGKEWAEGVVKILTGGK